jgi:hypothetical protein
MSDAFARARSVARSIGRRDRPLPRVTVALGRWVPGWAIRAAAVVVTPSLVLLAAARAHLVVTAVVVIAIALAAWTAVRPGPGPAHVAAALAAAGLLGSPAAPFDPAALWLAPLAYVTVRLGWWAHLVAPTDRVEAAALRHVAARDLVVAAVTVLLGAVSWAVAGRPVDGLVALGVAALAAVAWLSVGRHDGG